MSKTSLLLLGFLSAATVLPSLAQTTSLPATFKDGAALLAMIREKAQATSEQVEAPIANEPAYRINIVSRTKPGVAMAHATGPAKGTEVHYIIDGAATVITGGTLIRAAAGKASATSIDGGVTHHLTKGDVLVIPAGTPHWYQTVEGSVTYLEVRFDVEKK